MTARAAPRPVPPGPVNTVIYTIAEKGTLESRRA